ncbi:lysophospholipid acyltransferase LPEAT1 isoform X3 [Manihot esculenta]|uniref:lysophospholipid acyltransferase LPEAT1 isoform X3 n=1 Tax=Manihot esculenta TaxID=3983 RepID=UPI000B5D87E1|nr:lysophospholipid acyltransferase LPEAT1 isoform X3 [Manihot esculenta]
MENELKDVNPEPSKPRQPEPQPETANDNASNRDDRPLLKSDSKGMSTANIEDLEKKFAAFVRNDVYGTMGRGELPLAEKALLGFALVTLLPIRVMLAMIILFFYYSVCRICTLFSAPNRDVEEEQEDFAHMGGWSRAVIVRCGSFVSRVMLFLFGFYWIRESYRILEQPQNKSFTQNEGKDQSGVPERPGAIISNHVSYLDILYHMSSSFPSFVAKRSVGKLPLLGLISKCLGCVYVQRESKSSDFKGVAGAVTKRVGEAHQNESAPIMILFPEGTTTNGDFLLPFKTGAFLAGTPVLPVILRYPYQRFSPAWDSISGVRHVIFLLCQFINYIEVKRLPVYYPSQEEKDNPKLYASNVRWLMAREGDLVMSDIGLAEKRVYHAALNGNNSLPSILHQKDD